MKLAYLVNTYPQPSHSFIRREIQALERMDWQIHRFALRSDRARLVDAADIAEDGRTEHILSQGLWPILKKALPDAAEEDIFWGYHFVTGALMLTLARTGRIDKLSHGLCLSDDYEAVKHRMARFMAAGFREICEQRKRDRG